MRNRQLYLNTKPSKLFFKTAIPGGISMLVSSLYTVFDAIFVGQFVGKTAFAGLGLAIPIVIINFALAELIGVGSSVPISILLGKQEDKQANNFFSCSVLMIFITGLFMGVLMYFASPLFMKLMGAEGELAQLGVDYIRVYAIFSPFIPIIYALDNYLRICGKMKTSMVINICMSIGTILLELLFILGFEWGIVGASLGATVSMFICTIIGLSFFIKGKLQLKFVKPKFSSLLIKKIVKNGSPAFLTNVSGRIFSIVMNIMLLKMGGENAVAVYGILLTIGGIVEMLLYGVLDSLQPAMGYNYGAKQYERVRKIQKYCLITGAIISIFFFVIMISFSSTISMPFLEDASLLPLTTHALRLFCFAYLFKWVSHGIQSFLLAIEKSLPAMLISLSTSFVFPLILIAALLPLNLDGLWLNYTITSLFATIFSILVFKKMKNKIHLYDKPINID